MAYDQSGKVLARYMHGPNIDEPLAMEQETCVYFLPSPETVFKDHGDYAGNDRFDWTKEDHGASNPLIPLVGTPKHFQALEESAMQIDAAINVCDKDKFERAMHRLQDYAFHRAKGYGKIGGHAWDSIVLGRTPDNDNNAWQRSNDITKQNFDKWNKCGCANIK